MKYDQIVKPEYLAKADESQSIRTMVPINSNEHLDLSTLDSLHRGVNPDKYCV